jgi:hypothetical protein
MKRRRYDYELYFGQLRIGVVRHVDGDFPNNFGRLTYERWLADPRTAAQKRFARFAELNRECTRLVDQEHERDVSTELAAVNAKLEAKFTDYMDSPEWLVDRDGKDELILCPILRSLPRRQHEIVWRWA